VEYPVDAQQTVLPLARLGYKQGMTSWDDDDWVGEPPEGRHPASRADPDFWRGRAPISITAVGIGIALIILLIVWLF
jgi:hypothetical protein